MAKLLIVDDQIEIIKMLERRLSKCGHDIESAYDGREGVEKALIWKPDLILLDMHMPVMDGVEAAAELKKHNFQGKVVALTASARATVAEKYLNCGCDYFISKPIGRDFVEQLTEILQKNP